jgi:hypothetical protein
MSKHLLPDERLLWSGQPKQGLIFRKTDWGVIPFSVMWCAAVFVFESRAIRNCCPFVVGLLFAAVGAHMLVGRYVLDLWQRKTVWYALTNRRALIITGPPAAGAIQYVLKDVPEVELTERRAGWGSIYFRMPEGRQPAPSTWHLGGMPEIEVHRQFEFIPHARDVYQLIQSIQRGAQKSG